MSILKRTFLDVKRLSTISINNIVRTPWLLDYIKSAVKPLETINIDTNNIITEVRKYTMYNGQKLTLKTFVDDYYDISDRRTIISENKEETYSFYGYYDYVNEEWKREIDPNPTTFYGNYDYINEEWLEESFTDVNPPLYGYIKFADLEALQDVDLEYILDSYIEFIYTSENSTSEDDYIWFLEGQAEEGLIIYIHNDIYLNMTQEQIDKLYKLLEKYIISPIRYKIDGYE